MWEDLIQKAKDGGVDVIETYVFWNVHEPTPGNVPLLTPSCLSLCAFLGLCRVAFFFVSLFSSNLCLLCGL